MTTVLFKLAHSHAKMPTRGTEGSAGFDLYACEPAVIGPGETASVRTGVCLAMPTAVEVAAPETKPGHFGSDILNTFGFTPRVRFGVEAQVRGRSSLAFKHGVLGHVGTIDSDYRGELGVLLFNTRGEPYTVNVGDRVAQLVFAPVIIPDLLEAEELPESARGTNGYGSTGT